MQKVYLDYAAATPLDDNVLQTMLPFFSEHFYNPSALYEASHQVKQVVETSRAQIASLLGVKNNEVIFTAGATEANNLAISGILANFSNATVVTSAIEHPSILELATSNRKIASVDEFGLINMDDLKSNITDDVVLVSIIYANNEIGVIQNLREIAELINTIKQHRQQQANPLPLYFHSDCSQATNYLNLQLKKLGLDMATINAGKIYGPKQTACLYVKSDVRLLSQINGGGQEFGYRSGTENVPAIVGFAKALQITRLLANAESSRLSALRSLLIKGLRAIEPDIIINGHKSKTLPNIVNFIVPNIDNERLVYQLDEAGFMLATGSACSASNEEPSHVLMAIGLSKQQAASSLRLSMGRHITTEDINNFLAALKPLLPSR